MRVKPKPYTVFAAYEMLRSLPPYNKMRLPRAHKVRFVIRDGKVSFWGRVRWGKKGYIIEISEHQTLAGMIATLAHEMLHVKLNKSGQANPKDWHDERFRALAREVCTKLGIEVGGF